MDVVDYHGLTRLQKLTSAEYPCAGAGRELVVSRKHLGVVPRDLAGQAATPGAWFAADKHRPRTEGGTVLGRLRQPPGAPRNGSPVLDLIEVEDHPAWTIRDTRIVHFDGRSAVQDQHGRDAAAARRFNS